MYLKQTATKRWRYIVKHQGQQRTGTEDTRAKAQQAAAEALIEMGKIPKGSSATLDELLAVHLAEQGYVPRARKDLESLIDRLPAEVRAWHVGEVVPVQIEALYRRLRTGSDPWAPHALRRLHMVLSSAFSRAVGYGWILANPFYKRTPQVTKRKRANPTTAQVRKVLTELAGKPTRAGGREGPNQKVLFLRLSSTLGRRRGEIIGLTWSAVDLDRGIASIGQSVDHVDGTYVVSAGKTGEAGHSDIALDPVTIDMLRMHRKHQVELALASGLPSPVWVFSHNAGLDPWRGDYFSREFRRARDRCDLPGVHLHDVRHYVASSMLDDGDSIPDVAARLGIDAKTLMGVYAHRMPGKDRAAAERLARALDR